MTRFSSTVFLELPKAAVSLGEGVPDSVSIGRQKRRVAVPTKLGVGRRFCMTFIDAIRHLAGAGRDAVSNGVRQAAMVAVFSRAL